MELANAKKEIYTYKIQEQHYYLYGSLMSKKSEEEEIKPQFAQLYFYYGDNTEDQLNRRYELMQDSLNKNMLRELQSELHLCNPFVQTFKYARTEEKKEIQKYYI